MNEVSAMPETTECVAKYQPTRMEALRDYQPLERYKAEETGRTEEETGFRNLCVDFGGPLRC